jgi:hypothetical protein
MYDNKKLPITFTTIVPYGKKAKGNILFTARDNKNLNIEPKKPPIPI